MNAPAPSASGASGHLARPLSVLVLVPYPLATAPSQRYRIEQWQPLLEAAGFRLRYSAFLSQRTMDALYRPGRTITKLIGTVVAYARRLGELANTPPDEVIFLHREAFLLGPTRLEQTLLQKARVVYDFDDAIYLKPGNAVNRWAALAKSPRKPAALCRLAAHVSVGNDFLADFARQQSTNVTVIPSTIDTSTYRVLPRPCAARPVIGWTGSTTTVQYLKAIQHPLARVRQQVDFKLVVIGAHIELPGLDIRCIPWRAETEADDLRALDVGLMPLPDDPWTRGKCAMKALQYMALAIPPIVSPVGASASIVVDGENGFHARRDAEWVEKTLALLKSPQLRANLGSAGRRTVEAGYSASVQAPRVGRILAAVAERGRLDGGR